MEIRSADGGCVDPDYCVRVRGDLRLRDILPCLSLRAVIDKCLHDGFSFSRLSVGGNVTHTPGSLVTWAGDVHVRDGYDWKSFYGLEAAQLS
jgi:hypothetical protein